MTEYELLQNGIGRKLKFIGRAGYMLSIALFGRTEYEVDYQIHLDTDASIILNGTIYTSSSEIDDSRPYGACTFDRKSVAILSSRDLYQLRAISYDKNVLLHLYFSNGLEIHTLPSSQESDDELWRIFLSWTAEPSLVAFHSATTMEIPSCSQKELDKKKVLLQRRAAQRLFDR